MLTQSGHFPGCQFFCFDHYYYLADHAVEVYHYCHTDNGSEYLYHGCSALQHCNCRAPLSARCFPLIYLSALPSLLLHHLPAFACLKSAWSQGSSLLSAHNSQPSVGKSGGDAPISIKRAPLNLEPIIIVPQAASAVVCHVSVEAYVKMLVTSTAEEYSRHSICSSSSNARPLRLDTARCTCGAHHHWSADNCHSCPHGVGGGTCLGS